MTTNKQQSKCWVCNSRTATRRLHNEVLLCDDLDCWQQQIANETEEYFDDD